MPLEVTKEELKQLPLLAILAFAARCARRVSPLFDLPADHPERELHLEAVNGAIALAERAAKRFELADVDAANTAADLAQRAAGAVGPNAGCAANTAFVAAHVALAAANVGIVARDNDVARAGNAAYMAAMAARVASATADLASHPKAGGDAAAAARADFQLLVKLRLGQFPELGQPVNSESGALWTTGEPEWYRSKIQELRIHID